MGIAPITSELARRRVKPMHDGNLALLQDFDDYFANTIVEMASLKREVIDRATEIRAQYNVTTPDSLHLAAAVISNCDVFLTNDRPLNRFTGITIETVWPEACTPKIRFMTSITLKVSDDLAYPRTTISKLPR